MGSCGGCGGSVCGQTPCQCQQSFTELSAVDFGRTLAANLIPCVDQIRNIATCLGTRPYEVTMVRTRWTGGERGVGQEEIVSEEKILPTPLVDNINGFDTFTDPIGDQERGFIRVSEISARYTEDQLVGKGTQGEPIADDENFYWEIRLLTLNGYGPRRRCLVQAAPNLDMTNLQWTVRLIRIIADRSRVGEVNY